MGAALGTGALSANGDPCASVQNTPYFTFVYGAVTVGGADALAGTVVLARNPRGDVVGCSVVASPGNYGAMYVYGEDATVSPAIPGMRWSEIIEFHVDGVPATADPALAYANDRELHRVNLAAAPAPTPTPTSGQTQVDIPLVAGWNLISIPVRPASTVIEDVLSSIQGDYDLVYAYDAADAGDPWKKYDVAAPSFLNDLTHVDETMGLWIRASRAATLIVVGSDPLSTDIQLRAGWNLVGYPRSQARTVAQALSSIDGTYDLVYGYRGADAVDPWKKHDTVAPDFLNDLTHINPEWGFWIRVASDCTWRTQ